MLNKSNVFTLMGSLLVFMSAIALVSSLKLALGEKIFFFEWDIMSFNSLKFEMDIMLDWMSLLFLSVVSGISGSVVLYCIYYMSGEEHPVRFIFILLLFVVSMFMLIISPNLVSLLLGWDGLGLSSYLLVIYYQNESSYNAGMLTVLSNRVGDVAILMAIGLMISQGSWNIIYSYFSLTLTVSLLLMVAACTKSAQMPFSAWLPAAMAAPTPVSSLVHSSTLVTAGVWLLIRFSEMMDFITVKIICGVGLLTMIMSGIGANFEADAKKLVALSTLSQLGMMMLILGLGAPNLALFHLITHALFKSTLFMLTGFIIHSSDGSQDSRHMSTYSTSSASISLGLLITNMALCGIPFMSGFFSKDLIMESMYSSGSGFFFIILALMGVATTTLYSLRFSYKVFSSHANIFSVSAKSDMDLVVLKAVIMLFMFSVFGGMILSMSFFWMLDGLIMISYIKYFTILVISVMLVLGSSLFYFSSKYMMKDENLVYWFFGKMWFIPDLSTFKENLSTLFLSSKSSRLNEMGWLELYGAQGVRTSFSNQYLFIQSSQNSPGANVYVVGGVLFMLMMMFL